jgi:pimeloyl-ACP methyl ester carboxylesterase
MSELAYDRAGSGPPLVLLHPLGADRQVWRPVIELLGAERDCIAVDLPGFGESAPLTGASDPGSLAAAVVELFDGLGIGDGVAHLAGNSLGGWVALELASRGAAASVTAIAPAGLWPRRLPPKPEIGRGLARALRPLLAALMRSPRMRRLVLSGTMSHAERMPAADAAHLIRAYATASGFTAVNRAMRAGVFRELDSIAVPVTLVWPQSDRLVARRRNIPAGIRQLELPGCGHIPMWDDPPAVAAALLAGSEHSLPRHLSRSG